MDRACAIVAGPTATGKTKLAIALAKEINGAVISADSMQVYRGMDIGTAKVRPEETEGIRHYLIDCLEPEESFHVQRFQQMAKQAMEEIRAAGQVPVFAGGTGFYLQAVLRDIDFSESSGESSLRDQLASLAQENGREALHARLQEVDPEAAWAIHPNNAKRVIRALEFRMQTGAPISEHNRRQLDRPFAFPCAYFVLTDRRDLLYQRIDARVDQMVADGLPEEVRRLAERGLTEEHTSMKALGYRQLFPVLRGTCTLEEAVRKIKTETRHFAKRQLTWFRRERDVCWIDRSAFDQDDARILAYMLEKWKELDRDNGSK